MGMPLASQSPDARSSSSGSQAGIESSTDGVLGSILIVDDSAADRFLYERLLSSAGRKYRAIKAENIRRGIELAQSEKLDCILLDYWMPDADGFEFLEQLDTLGITTPVIMLTGESDAEISAKAFRFGAADYIIKGRVTLDALHDSIRQAIGSGQRQSRHTQIPTATGDANVTSSTGLEIAAVVEDTALPEDAADAVSEPDLDVQTGMISELGEQTQENLASLSDGSSDVQSNDQTQDLAATPRNSSVFGESADLAAVTPSRHPGQELEGSSSCGSDVSAEMASWSVQAMAGDYFTNAVDSIFIVDAATGRILQCNPSAEKLVNAGSGALLGRTILEAEVFWSRSEDWNLVVRQFESSNSAAELMLNLLNGRCHMALSHVRSWAGSKEVIYFRARNADREKRLEASLQQSTFLDSLSGLPNRKGLEAKLTRLWASAASNDNGLCIINLEIIEALAIRNTEGASALDDLLAVCTSKLRALCGNGRVLARPSWDQFSIIFEVGKPADVEAMLIGVENLDQQLSASAPHRQDAMFRVGCAAARPNLNTAPGKVLQMAEAQLSRARRSGDRNCQDIRLEDEGRAPLSFS